MSARVQMTENERNFNWIYKYLSTGFDESDSRNSFKPVINGVLATFGLLDSAAELENKFELEI